jgi:trehalose/maltose hydrolase-like predicted phosphorylase
MAGTVDLVLRCLTGMRARGSTLRFDPALPPQIKRLRFGVHYRGHRVDVGFAGQQLTVDLRPGAAPPITVLVRDESIELHPGSGHRFALGNAP